MSTAQILTELPRLSRIDLRGLVCQLMELEDETQVLAGCDTCVEQTTVRCLN